MPNKIRMEEEQEEDHFSPHFDLSLLNVNKDGLTWSYFFKGNRTRNISLVKEEKPKETPREHPLCALRPGAGVRAEESPANLPRSLKPFAKPDGVLSMGLLHLAQKVRCGAQGREGYRRRVGGWASL